MLFDLDSRLRKKLILSVSLNDKHGSNGYNWGPAGIAADWTSVDFEVCPWTHGSYDIIVRHWLTDHDSCLAVTTVDIPDCSAPVEAPEFPSVLMPATLIIGFLGSVLLIQRNREQ